LYGVRRRGTDCTWKKNKLEKTAKREVDGRMLLTPATDVESTSCD